MTEDMIDLARRAVACKGWRWMPGMLGWRLDNNGVPHSIRFVESVERMEALAGVGAGPLVASAYATYDGYWRSDDITPDLTDPATLGCLLALVREAWKSPVAQVSPSLPDGHIWSCYINDEAEDRLFRENTEAEALVAALEAAP